MINKTFLATLQKEIIRTKNTDILPFPMILMGSIVAAQWLLYGIILDNGFMIVSIVFFSKKDK